MSDSTHKSGFAPEEVGPQPAKRRTLPFVFTPEMWTGLVTRLGLSHRRAQMAEYICRGYSHERIATETGLSVNTVRMHMRHLYRQMSVRDRVGVVVRLVLAAREAESEDVVKAEVPSGGV
ncbi:MAG: hypothetical protein JXO22_12365 [Phycisphaerae bacterium]|nr:hypothetical protein [Phycisphaerae bacterium]